MRSRHEQRWAARFVPPVTSAAPKRISLKGAAKSLPTKEKEKPAGLGSAGLVSVGTGGVR